MYPNVGCLGVGASPIEIDSLPDLNLRLTTIHEACNPPRSRPAAYLRRDKGFNGLPASLWMPGSKIALPSGLLLP